MLLLSTYSYPLGWESLHHGKAKLTSVSTIKLVETKSAKHLVQENNAMLCLHLGVIYNTKHAHKAQQFEFHYT